MTQELRAGCDAFDLVLREAPDTHELGGELRFRADSRASTASVGLSLFGRVGTEPIGPGRIDAETPIAGASVRVDRDAADPTFVLALPPVASGYAGKVFQIAVGVVARADHGGSVRVVLAAPPSREGSRLLLRGLPRSTALAQPARCLLGVGVTLGGLALVALGASIEAEWAYALGSLAAAAGLVLSAIARRGMLGWLRHGPATVRLEAGEAGELVVTVQGSSRIAGGRARLVAEEYEVFEGASFAHGEIAGREAPLAKAGEGVWSARVPVPAAEESPPSLALRAPKRLLSIRWLVKLELATPSGGKAQSSVPIHVGVERSVG